MQDIRVVLVEPQEAGNVGAAARAMRNAGVRDLVVVRPRYRRDGDMWRLGVKAEPVLEAMRIVATLGEAVAGATAVVGTSDHPLPRRDRIVSPRELAARMPELGARVALLFGREDDGLRREELDRCRYVSAIPASRGQPVLNLAQAVLVHLYEIRLAAPPAPPAPPHPLATEDDRRRLLAHARRWLDGLQYKHRDQRARLLRRLRRLLAGHAFRPWDLTVIHTILRWAELGRRFPPRRDEGRSDRGPR